MVVMPIELAKNDIASSKPGNLKLATMAAWARPLVPRVRPSSVKAKPFCAKVLQDGFRQATPSPVTGASERMMLDCLVAQRRKIGQIESDANHSAGIEILVPWVNG